MNSQQRITLNEIPLGGIFAQPQVIVTMSTGQWDGILEAAYDSGAVLLELDDDEQPIRAYQRRQVADA